MESRPAGLRTDQAPAPRPPRRTRRPVPAHAESRESRRGRIVVVVHPTGLRISGPVRGGGRPRCARGGPRVGAIDARSRRVRARYAAVAIALLQPAVAMCAALTSLAPAGADLRGGLRAGLQGGEAQRRDRTGISGECETSFPGGTRTRRGKIGQGSEPETEGVGADTPT